jgi:hypothetical protein
VALAQRIRDYEGGIEIAREANGLTRIERNRGEAYTLREIHMNSMIINQNALHFKISLFTSFLFIKFDESIL